ncbi:unnamed protein product [Sphagnum balticum]
MYMDGRYGGKCYNVPVAVMHDGTIMFDVAGTDDLSLYALLLPCVNHQQPVMRTPDERFRNDAGFAHVLPAPLDLNTQPILPPADKIVFNSTPFKHYQQTYISTL